MFWDESAGGLHLEETDQCYTCTYYLGGIACPLLEALAGGVCTLAMEECTVSNCGFYVKFKRTLKLVTDETP